MNNLFVSIAVLFTIGLSSLHAHCEIPCGIYDDPLRISLLKEHTGTIAKSISEITRIEKEKNADYNQLVRWISNKEKHAEEIQHIVTQYFMTQRIKLPETADAKGPYAQKLGTLHEILVWAMKTKQSTDKANADKLLAAIAAFEKLYMTEHEKH